MMKSTAISSEKEYNKTLFEMDFGNTLYVKKFALHTIALTAVIKKEG
jgi:hypothetical protein